MRFRSRTSANGSDWHAQEVDWPADGTAVGPAKIPGQPSAGGSCNHPKWLMQRCGCIGSLWTS